jgi:hypothetical protein
VFFHLGLSEPKRNLGVENGIGVWVIDPNWVLKLLENQEKNRENAVRKTGNRFTRNRALVQQWPLWRGKLKTAFLE